VALCLGLASSYSENAIADYYSSTSIAQYHPLDRSKDKILIAGIDSDSHEAKSLIQLLESFLLSNTRNSDRAWWISTSGSISVLDEEDGVRAIIPDVKVVFNIDKKENLLVEIGDLELRISQESGEGLNISVQLPSPFRLRNPNGSVAAELSFNSSQFTLNWDSELKTIIGNQFDFRDISLREKDNLIGRIERIESRKVFGLASQHFGCKILLVPS
jgi:hypothetical protein